MSHHKEHSFDAYCKTILRRTAANAHKQRKRLAVREIPFSGLSETELNRLCCYDDYESDKQTFTACGREIEIRCDALCLALEALTQRQRDILLYLRNEIMKALDGSSAFTPELLGGMIKEQEAKYAEQQTALEAAQKEAENTALAMQEMSAQYNQFVEWAYVYDTASMETRKMIVAQLFERIEVYRDYKLKIKFTISVEQFLQGLDNIA